MASAKALDDFVKAEIAKIKPLGGFAVSFSVLDAYPGQGEFTITGCLNGASIEYRHKRDDGSAIGGPINLKLLKDGDSIIIKAKKDGVFSMNVNDRRYDKPGTLMSALEEDEFLPKPDFADNSEMDEVFEFGKKAIYSVRAAIERYVPGALDLIEGYFSRSLLPPEENPDLRTNAEIFAKFNLDTKL